MRLAHAAFYVFSQGWHLPPPGWGQTSGGGSATCSSLAQVQESIGFEAQVSLASSFLPRLVMLEAHPGLSKTWIAYTNRLILGFHIGLPLSYCNCFLVTSVHLFQCQLWLDL